MLPCVGRAKCGEAMHVVARLRGVDGCDGDVQDIQLVCVCALLDWNLAWWVRFATRWKTDDMCRCRVACKRWMDASLHSRLLAEISVKLKFGTACTKHFLERRKYILNPLSSLRVRG